MAPAPKCGKYKAMGNPNKNPRQAKLCDLGAAPAKCQSRGLRINCKHMYTDPKIICKYIYICIHKITHAHTHTYIYTYT
jgi:hypothetical protein